MLEMRDLTVTYGMHLALAGVSARIDKGEIVVVLGANGAGKSTLLRAVAGICEGETSGDVRFGDRGLSGLAPEEIVEAGIALVPEDRGIFGDLSVRENLTLGAYGARARRREKENLNRVLGLFPRLRERSEQIVRTMSGGEQQMVAIGRAMMSEPEILMLDEPSLGLSPMLCKELFQTLAGVRDAGIGILLVEQNARRSLAIADRGYLLENGEIVGANSSEAMLNDPAVQAAYLGGGGNATPEPRPTPAPPTGAPIQPGRRPVEPAAADTLAGGSITDLVARASAASATSAARTAPVAARRDASHEVPTPPDPVAEPSQDDPGVRTILHEMERAAAAARAGSGRPNSQARSSVRDLPQPGRKQFRRGDDPPADPPPSIEVYRRPLVRVYRRGADGFDGI